MENDHGRNYRISNQVQHDDGFFNRNYHVTQISPLFKDTIWPKAFKNLVQVLSPAHKYRMFNICYALVHFDVIP